MSAGRSIRARFWVAAALAVFTGALSVLALLSTEWIEMLFGIAPDDGDGSLEWTLVGAPALTAVVFSGVSLVEWRRPIMGTDE